MMASGDTGKSENLVINAGMSVIILYCHTLPHQGGKVLIYYAVVPLNSKNRPGSLTTPFVKSPT